MLGFIDNIDGALTIKLLGLLIVLSCRATSHHHSPRLATKNKIIYKTNNFYIPGRVSSLHRSSAASRQDLRLHLVQPASCEAKIFQETREEDESGGGEEVQRGVDGKNLVHGPFLGSLGCFLTYFKPPVAKCQGRGQLLFV